MIKKLKPFLFKNTVECGCDEAGRGCLAGPVYAAAVVLPPKFNLKGLNDSKQLTLEQRLELREKIIDQSISYAVADLSNVQIDKYNILNASILAMHKAIDLLSIVPQHLLIDGNRFIVYKEISHTCIIQGDAQFASIAAASVLAKTFRDEYMEAIHEDFPMYCWDTNKGYPTKEHRDAIIKYGVTKYHRRTFNLYPPPIQTSLFDENK